MQNNSKRELRIIENKSLYYPAGNEIDDLKPGEIVHLVLEFLDGSRETQHIWAEIKTASLTDNEYVGIVEMNPPEDYVFQPGDEIRFSGDDVIDIYRYWLHGHDEAHSWTRPKTDS